MTADGRPEAGAAHRPLVNAHVHLPPNFSAFDSCGQAVEEAARQGLRVLGASNYFHFGPYATLRDATQRRGVVPLFGIEIITLVEELRRDGVLVNDPTNPGRMYLCGKGIARFDPPSPEAADRLARMRAASDGRIREMSARLERCFATAGLATGLDDTAIAGEVARAAGVPLAWVSLQERHLARAFQEALFGAVEPAERPALLARAYGAPAMADPRDPVAVQEEIRARLMKAGRPAFVEEAAISFDEAYRLILELGGIPCYPTLADGATPVCAYEHPPEALARTIRERGVYCAELIPRRNRPDVVDRYVAAFRDAGIVMVAGTEHNTPERIPLEPRCRDGVPLSEAAQAAFWEGACVVAAHQDRVASGRAGYVDGEGRLAPGFTSDAARIAAFAAHGAACIGAGGGAGTPAGAAAS